MKFFRLNAEDIYKTKSSQDCMLFKDRLVFKESSTLFNQKTMDMVEVSPRKLNLKDSNNIYIVKLYANKPWQTRVKELANRSIDNNAVVIGVNVVSFNIQSSVQKSIKVVENLISSGINPSNIVLEGLCLGGGVATLTAKHFLDKGITLNLFADRGFAKSNCVFTRSVLEGIEPGHKIQRWFIRVILGGIEKSVTSHEHSNIDIGKSFLALREKSPERTNYSVIRLKKDKSGKIIERDATVSYDNSLHYILREEKTRIKKPFKAAIAFLMDSKNSKVSREQSTSILMGYFNDYRQIRENNFEKEQNLAFFKMAIKKVEQNDGPAAIVLLKHAVKRINGYHKFEKLYSDEQKALHSLNGQFLFNSAYSCTLLRNENIDFNRVNPDMLDRIQNEEDIIASAGNHTNTMQNPSIGAGIDGKNSMFESFIQNIKKLNDTEKKLDNNNRKMDCIF